MVKLKADEFSINTIDDGLVVGYYISKWAKLIIVVLALEVDSVFCLQSKFLETRC